MLMILAAMTQKSQTVRSPQTLLPVPSSICRRQAVDPEYFTRAFNIGVSGCAAGQASESTKRHQARSWTMHICNKTTGNLP